VLKAPSSPEKWALRTYLNTTVPPQSPIQTTVSLPFQSGEKAVSTKKMAAKRNGSLYTRQAPSTLRTSRSFRVQKGLSKRSKTKAKCEE